MSGISPPSFASLLARHPLERVGWGGTRRCCFRLGESGLCVKFYKPRALYDAEKVKPSIRRDIDRRRFDPKRNSSCQEVAVLERYRQLLPEKLIAAHFPPVCERVFHPDYGWGVLETYYTNPDGTAIIPYEFEIARQTPRNQEIIYAQAAALLDKLIAAGAPFYEPGNFHTLLKSDGSIETKVVDFEPTSKTLLPLEAFWPWFRRRKLARKAARYLAHIRTRYHVAAKSLVQLAAEDAFGVAFASFVRVHAGNSSANYRAATTSGDTYFVKCASRRTIDGVLKRQAQIVSPLVPAVAFAGRTGESGKKALCAFAWATDGASVPPGHFTPADIAAILAGYRELSRAFAAVDASALDAWDGLDEAAKVASLKPCAIHGDFHYKNFFLASDPARADAPVRLTACFDFECMRRGLPTEDLLRIFVHALERTRFWRFATIGAILRNFTCLVRASDYSEAAFLAAIDLYERHKRARRRAKAAHPLWAALEAALRAPLYRRLRRAVKAGMPRRSPGQG